MSPSPEDEGFAHFMEFAERARNAQQAVNDLGAGPPDLAARINAAAEAVEADRRNRRAVVALAAYYDDEERAFTQGSIDRMNAAIDAAHAFTVAEARAAIDAAMRKIAEAFNLEPGLLPQPRDWRGTEERLVDEMETPPHLAPQRWIDNQGDVWTLGDDGLLHSPETAAFCMTHVEKKCGPLVPLPAERIIRGD